ncbi:MAG: type II secretion system F family protein [Burkholderiales bacterium]|nr:type II secretion system F family protein [Burkholderiales bacterium]
MPNIYILFLVAFFFAVFGGAMMLMRYLLPSQTQQRLQKLGESPVPAERREKVDWVAKVAQLSSPLAKLSMPEEGWENSVLRTRFMNAGLRSEHAPVIYFSVKTLLAALTPILLWAILVNSLSTLSTNQLIVILLVAAAIGFYLPNLIVRRLIAARKLTIFENIPDALDLMTICIEAGLAMDAAIARVAQEMNPVAPVISEELHLVTLELRAGNSKEKALRNLAMRTGVEDVDTLVGMLIQAERFGTSIGDALRVHSEHLRTKRRQRAEEAAAKIALKLLFPLIFCIFPALLMVLVGPAAIQIYHAIISRTS